MKYVETDFIPMSRENANWLYRMQVITRYGTLIQNRITMQFRVKAKDGTYKMADKDTSSWSVLCELYEKAREHIRAHPDIDYFTTDGNDALDLIRKGSLEIPYEKENIRFVAKFQLNDDMRNRLGEWMQQMAD